MTIEQLLVRDSVVTYVVEGKSMLPMLCPNKDVVTIKKREPDQVPQLNDVVLYRAKFNLVLHRIVKILPNDKYEIMGDNCSQSDLYVDKDQIIGILDKFIHNGKSYTLIDPVYMDYISRLRKIEKKRVQNKKKYDLVMCYVKHFPKPIYNLIKRVLTFWWVNDIKFYDKSDTNN